MSIEIADVNQEVRSTSHVFHDRPTQAAILINMSIQDNSLHHRKS